MTKTSYPLKLPTSIKDAAQRLAKEDGVSLNQWIASAVAQKVGAAQTVAHFLEQRAGQVQPNELVDLLRSVPANAPSPQDALAYGD